jgi:hypothetical protein
MVVSGWHRPTQCLVIATTLTRRAGIRVRAD